MGFPGVWMTESESLIYRVVPKCACSTIGQIMFFSDHGRFFDGDIHDSKTGLHKWAQEDSQPLIEANGYRFTVKVGKPKDVEKAKGGTKLSRGANFECLMSGTPMAGGYIKGEGKAGRMGARLMAIVAEGTREQLGAGREGGLEDAFFAAIAVEVHIFDGGLYATVVSTCYQGISLDGIVVLLQHLSGMLQIAVIVAVD